MSPSDGKMACLGSRCGFPVAGSMRLWYERRIVARAERGQNPGIPGRDRHPTGIEAAVFRPENLRLCPFPGDLVSTYLLKISDLGDFNGPALIGTIPVFPNSMPHGGHRRGHPATQSAPGRADRVSKVHPEGPSARPNCTRGASPADQFGPRPGTLKTLHPERSSRRRQGIPPESRLGPNREIGLTRRCSRR